VLNRPGSSAVETVAVGLCVGCAGLLSGLVDGSSTCMGWGLGCCCSACRDHVGTAVELGPGLLLQQLVCVAKRLGWQAGDTWEGRMPEADVT
jgi:hypothetical protein